MTTHPAEPTATETARMLRRASRPHARGRRLPAVLLCAAACIAGAAAAQETPPSSGNFGAGHLTVRSLSPGHLLLPNISLADLPRSARGSWRVTAGLDWGNVWNHEPDWFTVDGEWLLTAVRVSYALTDRAEIGISLPFSMRTGGVMDSTIENFHNIFGLSNAGRGMFPRDETRIDVLNRRGERHTIEGDHTGINDIPLFVTVLLTRGNGYMPATAIHAAATIPAGDEAQLEGLGEPLYSIGLVFSKRMGDSPHLLYGGAGSSVTDQERVVGIELRQQQYTGMLGWEYQWSTRLSLLAQYLVCSPIAEDYFQYANETHELNIGFRRQVRDDLVFEWSFTENVFNFENSVDVGMHLGVTYLY